VAQWSADVSDDRGRYSRSVGLTQFLFTIPICADHKVGI
jgi:hypothetical protein